MREDRNIIAYEMIIETNRDVKWICKTLEDMKGSIEDHEARIRKLESFSSETKGSEGKIAAGLGAGAGGVVAVLLKFFGG
ncbi:hypothetical protein F1737_07910 [Methanoplanus sp. FWC-SCC4]|uniref:Uncharacterized protein n=1 Tax=Methanochimaera problematica TaxID=2609417 RepID=A0AA97FE61_9EURY|nr:hypothetical protein [Methanoplanus sp. FWC-SCC4]WOF16623.1 hypothetical protein F1737_07910 [Methanoplanus sp. FWC-SCC4]